MFLVHAVLDGKVVEVGWDNGLIGDDQAIKALKEFAAIWPHPVGLPAGPYWEGLSMLTDPLAVYCVILRVFSDAHLVKGEMPEAPTEEVS